MTQISRLEFQIFNSGRVQVHILQNLGIKWGGVDLTNQSTIQHFYVYPPIQDQDFQIEIVNC